MSKRSYQEQAARVRAEIIRLQLRLKEAPFKVLLILAGPEGSGRGELLHTLAEWLDPRGVDTFSFHPPTEDERVHPDQWRLWRDLPAMGRIGLYAGSWYTETLREEARNQRARRHLLDEAERIRRFEKLLADGGTLILKVWLHLSRKAQGRRLRTLRSDSSTAWRVTDEDWQHHLDYDRLAEAATLIRQRTSRPGARWTIIDAEDERTRDLAVARLLLRRFREQERRFQRMAAPRAAANPRTYFAEWIACHTRSGVAGMSKRVMPRGFSASSIAFIITASAPVVPASPPPFTPSGLPLVMTSLFSTLNSGNMSARGMP